MTWRCLSWSRCLLLLVAAKAWAGAPGPTVEAHRLMGELRFPEASAELQRTLGLGGLEPDVVASVYLLWAEAEASMGHESYAAELFGRGLFL